MEAEGRPQDVTFLPVRAPEQVETVSALAHTIWNECYHGMLPQGQIDYMTGKFQSTEAITRQIGEGYHFFLVLAGGDVAGYLGAQPQESGLFLSKIYFLAQYRGMGLARESFSFLDGFAREHGCGTVWLTVHKYNERAKAAYRKAGFVQTRDYVADIGGGYVMDDYVFERAVGTLSE